MVTWANGSPHPRLWRERDRVSNATLPHFKCERAVLNRNPSADSKLKGRTQNADLAVDLASQTRDKPIWISNPSGPVHVASEMRDESAGRVVLGFEMRPPLATTPAATLRCSRRGEVPAHQPPASAQACQREPWASYSGSNALRRSLSVGELAIRIASSSSVSSALRFAVMICCRSRGLAIG